MIRPIGGFVPSSGSSAVLGNTSQKNASTFYDLGSTGVEGKRNIRLAKENAQAYLSQASSQAKAYESSAMFGAIGDVIGSVGGFLSQGLAPGGFLRGNGGKSGGGGGAPVYDGNNLNRSVAPSTITSAYTKPFFTSSRRW